MKSKKGQALVLILILMIVMVSITTAAVAMVVVNSQLTSESESGNQALAAAESGAENALLLLLRDPLGYSGGSVDLYNRASASVTVPAGDYPKVIISIGKYDIYTRKVEVGLIYTNNELQITSWKETF